ncbi:sugar porter family MFS transporter [Halocatena pleomorpha]|uniref:Sugar porter family MFS transporter n=1 Tax=Halocatena pleomorpha TaxID=1785090 RepID=A0A3P3R7F2_9EURY|nr:sugar porter family MFS transporter [Halocatena pleomorpha]RRJ28938.1 sugar porter family MFS transporter [Halocatena pleomorpha]
MSVASTLFNADKDHSNFVYVIAAIAALNGLLFGFDVGVISGALLYINQSFALSPFLEGVVTSSVLVGAMIGAATGGQLADRFGRRRLTIAGAAVFFIGSFGMALAPTVEWLIAWRIIEGVAVGIASVVGPLMISETAPPDIRGSLGFLQQLMITIGILMAYLVNYAFAPEFLGVIGWRWMFVFGALPAAILGLGVYFVPESPRWLVEHGEEDTARSVLSRIRAKDEVDDEIERIREVSEIEEQGGLSDLLKPWVRPALVVGVGLAIIQQFSGINTIIYYAPTILNNIGFGDIASIAGTIGVGIVNVGMTIIAIMLVDRVGRRPLLLVGTGGMTVMLAILGLGFFLPGLSGVVGYVTLGSMLLYVAFYAISLGPVFWLLISEIYPLQIRGTAEGVASVFNWGANFLVGLTFLSLMEQIGESWSFWILGVFCILAFVFIYFKVPETMGRSLEEIEADLHEGSPVSGETEMDVPDRDREQPFE